MLKVYRKRARDEWEEPLLGNYLNIIPVIYTDPEGDITTDVMVYFSQDDGSVGTDNRENVYIRDTELHYAPVPMVDEDDLIESEMEFDEGEI